MVILNRIFNFQKKSLFKQVKIEHVLQDPNKRKMKNVCHKRCMNL